MSPSGLKNETSDSLAGFLAFASPTKFRLMGLTIPAGVAA